MGCFGCVVTWLDIGLKRLGVSSVQSVGLGLSSRILDLESKTPSLGGPCYYRVLL